MPRISLKLFIVASIVYSTILTLQLGGKAKPIEIAVILLYAPASLLAMLYGMNILPGKLISDHNNYCRNFLGLQDKLQAEAEKVSFQPHNNIAPLATILFLSVVIPITMSELTVRQIIIEMFFMQTLFVLAFVDFKYFILPEEITLPLVILGLSVSVLGSSNLSLEESVMGAIFPASALAITFIILKLVTRKELMGTGDYYLISVLGAWFGISKLPSIILMATAISIVYALLFKTRKIPLGLPLVISAYLITFIPGISF